MTPYSPSPSLAVPVPLGAVEAAAEGATEGPWEVEGDKRWPRAQFVSAPGRWVVSPDEEEQGVFPQDATHIAASDPPTIKALTAALRLAREALDDLAHGAVPHQVAPDALRSIDALVDFGLADTGGTSDG